METVDAGDLKLEIEWLTSIDISESIAIGWLCLVFPIVKDFVFNFIDESY